MIILKCDWCGCNNIGSAEEVDRWLVNLQSGERNRCNTCEQAWVDMQEELKATVAEFRQETIEKLKVKYLGSS